MHTWVGHPHRAGHARPRPSDTFESETMPEISSRSLLLGGLATTRTGVLVACLTRSATPARALGTPAPLHQNPGNTSSSER